MKPDDWQIPTFREISEPVTTFGVSNEEAFTALMIGGGGAIILLIASGFSHDVSCFYWAVAEAVTVIPVLFLVFRRLHKIDPHWVEHLTTDRYPAAVYLAC